MKVKDLGPMAPSVSMATGVKLWLRPKAIYLVTFLSSAAAATALVLIWMPCHGRMEPRCLVMSHPKLMVCPASMEPWLPNQVIYHQTVADRSNLDGILADDRA